MEHPVQLSRAYHQSKRGYSTQVEKRAEEQQAQVPGHPHSSQADCGRNYWLLIIILAELTAAQLEPVFLASGAACCGHVTKFYACEEPHSPKGMCMFPGSLPLPAGGSGSCLRPRDGNHMAKLPWLALDHYSLECFVREKYTSSLLKPWFFFWSSPQSPHPPST